MCWIGIPNRNDINVYLVYEVYFLDEDYSLLSSIPEVSTVDVDSDEFQEVVKEFYETLQDNHNKIKIIKVWFNIVIHRGRIVKNSSWMVWWMGANLTEWLLQVEANHFYL